MNNDNEKRENQKKTLIHVNEVSSTLLLTISWKFFAMNESTFFTSHSSLELVWRRIPKKIWCLRLL